MHPHHARFIPYRRRSLHASPTPAVSHIPLPWNPDLHARTPRLFAHPFLPYSPEFPPSPFAYLLRKSAACRPSTEIPRGLGGWLYVIIVPVLPAGRERARLIERCVVRCAIRTRTRDRLLDKQLCAFEFISGLDAG